MKKRRCVAYIISLVFIAVFSILNFYGKESVEPPQEKAITKISRDREKKDVAPLKKRNMGRLRKKIIEAKHEVKQENEYDRLREQYPDLETMTDEQIERGKLHTKTDPYFWEMAPALLEEMWKNEEIDRDWTVRVNEEAENLLKNDQYEGTSLLEIDCRQSLCRIEFAHVDIEASNRFKRSDMRNGSWISEAGNSLGGFAESDTGQISTFIYFTGLDDSETFFRMRETIAERKGLI